ncbi:hypothetical protein B0H11DRAFT_2401170 [Mycena galericulata]|nr:hypothetical protein B0H11DRAFT_2401170 [Mycena galericulata]
MALATRLVADVHTHVYLPRYCALLRHDGKPDDRLLILDHEPSGGRPVGPQYWDRDEKLKFMDRHGIDLSVVRRKPLASQLNEDLEVYCSESPRLNSSLKRIYGFGLLPLVPDISTAALLETIEQISKLSYLKGIIMGSRGIGKGLDDEALDPVWAALEKAGLVVFLHPHYGVDEKAWGGKENGHVLPLALGFPFETTIATTRLILAGVLDRFPRLLLLLAHSGGALPQLSSRLASCIDHDPVVAARLKHDARWYLGKLYFDAVAYGPEELGFVSDVIARAVHFESGGFATLNKTVDRTLGSRRMLFGTDNPFFPPLRSTEKWESVVENLQAIDAVSGWGQEEKDGVRGGNALSLFNLV